MTPRPCVLIPVFNHAGTLAGVARAAAAHGPVLVVDDGSSEDVAGALAGVEGLTLFNHNANLGKGAALRTGFAQARALGFTHVIVMDADGQHDGADLPAFMQGVAEQPAALHVGVRDLKKAGAPRLRRWANRFSNLWFRLETHLKLTDTQCGFRAYPLEAVAELTIRAERYAYELECLVRAAWVGLRIIPVPVRVRYDGPSYRSHFRPVVDFLRISLVNARLFFEALILPLPFRALISRGALRACSPWQRGKMAVRQFLTENTETPGQLALAVGLGFFFAIAPIWGYQMAAAIFFAHLFRLNKAVTLAASNLSFPLALPFILYASLYLGHLALHHEALHLDFSTLTREVALSHLVAYLAGSLLLAVAMALVGIALGYGLGRMVLPRRRTA